MTDIQEKLIVFKGKNIRRTFHQEEITRAQDAQGFSELKVLPKLVVPLPEMHENNWKGKAAKQ